MPDRSVAHELPRLACQSVKREIAGLCDVGGGQDVFILQEARVDQAVCYRASVTRISGHETIN